MKKFIFGLVVGLAFVGTSSYAVTTLITQQGGTGTTTPSGILYGDNGATTHLNTVTIGSGCTFTAGTLSCGAGTITSVTGTYPVQSSGGTTPVISLAFGTTTSNTWGGTQTFTNTPILGALSGLIAGNAGALYASATTTASCSGSASCTPFTILGSSPITISASAGGGANVISTTTPISISNLAYFTGVTPTSLGGVATSTLTATSPLTGSFTHVGTTGSLGCQTASGSQAGCLSSTDWTTFNGKQAAGNYITALTGDVTATGPGSVAATIANNAVTYAKFQQVAANSLVGNPTGATANAQAIATSSLNLLPATILLPKGNFLVGNDAGVAQATSTIFITSLGAIGVNTAVPSAMFDVKGTSTAATGQIADFWKSDGTNVMRVRNDGNVGIGTTSPYAVLSVSTPVQQLGTLPLFEVASTTNDGIFTVLGNGNVGIGTTSPLRNLDIYSAANTPTFSFRGGTFAMPVIPTFNPLGDTIGNITNFSSSSGGITLQGISNGLNSGMLFEAILDSTSPTLTNSAMTFRAAKVDGSGTRVAVDATQIAFNFRNFATTNLFTILGSGNAGLATSSPYAQLSLGGGNLVLGAATAGGTPGDLFLPKLGTAAGTFLAVDATGKVIATTTPSGGASLTGTTGQIAYFSGTNTAVGTSTIFITPAGNIGIGTIAPTDVNANARLTVAGISSQDIIASTTDNTTLSDAIIQAYAPGSRVFLGAHGTNQVSTRYGLTLGGWGELGAFNSTSGTTNGLIIGTNPAVPIVFGTNNLERMRILSGGNVGIGSTTPYALLSVNAPAGTAPYFSIGSSTAEVLKVTASASPFLGVGTTSPFANISLQTGTGSGFAFAIATSSGAMIGGYDNDGHRFTSGPAPIISVCGTGTGTVVGDDQSGTITTATAATACTATFSKAYKNTPVCTVTDDSLVGFADISSISTSAVTFGISSALTGGHLYYSCQYHY